MLDDAQLTSGLGFNHLAETTAGITTVIFNIYEDQS